MLSARRVVGVTAIALALLGNLASAALAEPGGAPPESSDPGAPGSRDAAIDVTEQLAWQYAQPGFGKVVVDYSVPRVTVYWKGSPPASVESMLGTTNGVEIVLKQALYSEADLTAAGKKVLNSERQLFGIGTIAAAVPRDDMSGLEVEVVADTESAQLPEVTAARLRAVTGIPIEVRTVQVFGSVLTRQDDYAPWQGGGAMANSAGEDY